MLGSGVRVRVWLLFDYCDHTTATISSVTKIYRVASPTTSRSMQLEAGDFCRRGVVEDSPGGPRASLVSYRVVSWSR